MYVGRMSSRPSAGTRWPVTCMRATCIAILALGAAVVVWQNVLEPLLTVPEPINEYSPPTTFKTVREDELDVQPPIRKEDEEDGTGLMATFREYPEAPIVPSPAGKELQSSLCEDQAITSNV